MKETLECVGEIKSKRQSLDYKTRARDYCRRFLGIGGRRHRIWPSISIYAKRLLTLYCGWSVDIDGCPRRRNNADDEREREACVRESERARLPCLYVRAFGFYVSDEVGGWGGRKGGIRRGLGRKLKLNHNRVWAGSKKGKYSFLPQNFCQNRSCTITKEVLTFALNDT